MRELLSQDIEEPLN